MQFSLFIYAGLRTSSEMNQSKKSRENEDRESMVDKFEINLKNIYANKSNDKHLIIDKYVL